MRKCEVGVMALPLVSTPLAVVTPWKCGPCAPSVATGVTGTPAVEMAADCPMIVLPGFGGNGSLGPSNAARAQLATQTRITLETPLSTRQVPSLRLRLPLAAGM